MFQKPSLSLLQSVSKLKELKLCIKLEIEKICELSNEDVVWIIKSRTDFWCNKTKELAKTEFKKRKLNEFDYTGFWETVDIELERSFEEGFLISLKEIEKKEELDSFEKWTTLFFAPFDLIRGRLISRFYRLYKKNEEKKFDQKAYLTFFSVIIWIVISYLISSFKK